MIALREGPKKEPEVPPTLRLARRLVASRLLSGPAQAARGVRAWTWKLWLLTAALAAVLAASCFHWLGIW
jgi:hypothetical protein